jgi:ADP-ribose pyrophosphatase YjhB (NUDIX family)
MPAFGLVVNERNEIVMIQRGYGSQKGQWSLPGGQRDKGESLQRTAVRETLEETGLRMSADELYYKSDRHSFEIWRGKWLSGHIKAQRRECLDAKWFQIDMLPHDDNLAFGPDKRAIGKWAANNQGSRRVYYPRSPMSRAGFVLLVDHHDRVLLMQRKGGTRAGKWSLPGGKARSSERRRDAAVRETNQATGLFFDLESLYLENRHQAQVWRGSPHLATGNSIYGRWFPVDSLPDDDSLGFAIDVRTIEKWAADNPGSRRVRYS